MKVIMKLIAFLLTVMPFAAFADGEDVTTIVKAFTDEEGGDVTKNVGNVTVTTKYNSNSAYGILAEAESNRTATVTAKNIEVNVPAAKEQAGVEVWSGYSAGTVNITTNNIKSGQHGVQAYAEELGYKTTVTVNGDIEAGAYDTEFGYRSGSGVIAIPGNGGIVNVTVNGDINAKDRGVLISAVGDTDPSTGGTANVEVYGDVMVDGTANAVVGAGVEFDGHTDKADVLVTGVVSGVKMGVYSDTLFYPSTGESKLTAWKIESESGNLFTKRVGIDGYEADNDFPKKVNYIIRHADNVLPKKADGSAIAESHNLPVAKEGDKIIIDTPYDGISINKAFNNGVEITTKDENGNFYVVVERGGGINLTIEADLCPYDPNKLDPGICGCGMDDVDSDGDGTADCEDVCPEDPVHADDQPIGGCFVNGSNIPERYDPKVSTDVIANPKTKVLPPFVLRDGNKASVYYERFAGGVIKVGDTKLGKTKYEVMLKTKLKKKKAKTKTLKQALTKNYRTIKLKKGQTVTLKYRMVITKKVRKKSVTKRTKWSKAEKIQYLPIK